MVSRGLFHPRQCCDSVNGVQSAGEKVVNHGVAERFGSERTLKTIEFHRQGHVPLDQVAQAKALNTCSGEGNMLHK